MAPWAQLHTLSPPLRHTTTAKVSKLCSRPWLSDFDRSVDPRSCPSQQPRHLNSTWFPARHNQQNPRAPLQIPTRENPRLGDLNRFSPHRKQRHLLLSRRVRAPKRATPWHFSRIASTRAAMGVLHVGAATSRGDAARASACRLHSVRS
jgi:hypothetical protein